MSARTRASGHDTSLAVRDSEAETRSSRVTEKGTIVDVDLTTEGTHPVRERPRSWRRGCAWCRGGSRAVPPRAAAGTGRRGCSWPGRELINVGKICVPLQIKWLDISTS